LFLQEGVFPAARAKNCENQREYHDLTYVIEGLSRRRVNRFKRTPWGRSTFNLNGRAGGVVWHEGVFPSLRAKNSENQSEYHGIIDAMVELSGRQVDTSKRTLWGRSTSNLNGRAWVAVLEQGCLPLCWGQK
jgi:hypothetical protein